MEKEPRFPDVLDTKSESESKEERSQTRNNPSNVVSETSTTEENDVQEYPTTFKLILIIIALSLAILCIGLDNTIISTAIPKITDEFYALEDVGWYASAYLLTNCAFQLTWGKLYSYYSIKWTFLTALFIFELGSTICGAAPSSIALIVGRAIAGVGSGGVSSGAFLMVAHSVTPRKRPTFIGLIGGMYGFSSILGPLLGGTFTNSSTLTWRFCFYVNLPLGFITAVFLMIAVGNPRGKKTRTTSFVDQIKQMDVPGMICVLTGVVCLVLALQWGGTKYEWKNGRTIALLIISAALLIGFVSIQVRSGERATVPLRVFGNRNIWGSAIFGGCVIGAFFVMLYYIAIWFQAIKGASPIMAGVMNLPMVLSFVVFSLLGGATISYTGYYIPFVYLTVIFMSIGTGLLSTLQPNSSSAKWIGYQVLFGAGSAFGISTALTAAQTALPLEDIPIGTATVLFAENLVGAIMVSVAQNVFTNQLVANLKAKVPGIESSVVLETGATQIKNEIPGEFYDDVLNAYNQALIQTFYVAVALSCFAAFGAVSLQWLSVKGSKKMTAGEEEI